MVKEIETIDDFKNAIGNENTGLVIIDFFTSWCGPCKIISPKYAAMSEKYTNVGFYKINADNAQLSAICDACEIKSLPTFCFFLQGKYINRFIGANDVNLEKMIVDNIPKN